MIVRCVKSAFVSAAFLAAIATSCGTSYASPASNAELARSGYALLQKGEASSALQAFSAAIDSGELQPEVLANALLNRALAYQQLGNHDNAITDYSSAIALDVMAPSLRATALYNRGLSQLKLHRAQAAVEDFTSSLLLNPKSPYAYYSRGNALRDNGQFLFALSDYERALRNGHPNKAQVLYASANTYISLNRPNDAKKALNSALLANPDFGQARAQLIMLGDQNAKLQNEESDPILTGSVAAFSGGTVATKPQLPKAVEPPDQLVTASTAPIKKKKLFNDRIPAVDAANLQTASATPAVEQVVEVEQVPEIPAPVKEKKAAAKTFAPVPAAVVEPEVAPAAAEPAAAQAESIDGNWSVQIASAASEDAAWSTWKKMQSKHGILKDQNPRVVRADLGAKGVFYRIRLGGFEDQKSAGKACSKLKSKGVTCFVSKLQG